MSLLSLLPSSCAAADDEGRAGRDWTSLQGPQSHAAPVLGLEAITACLIWSGCRSS